MGNGITLLSHQNRLFIFTRLLSYNHYYLDGSYQSVLGTNTISAFYVVRDISVLYEMIDDKDEVYIDVPCESELRKKLKESESGLTKKNPRDQSRNVVIEEKPATNSLPSQKSSSTVSP